MNEADQAKTRPFRVNQRIVLNTSTLVRATSEDQAEDIASESVYAMLTDIMKDHGRPSDTLDVSDIEATDTYETDEPDPPNTP